MSIVYHIFHDIFLSILYKFSYIKAFSVLID